MKNIYLGQSEPVRRKDCMCFTKEVKKVRIDSKIICVSKYSYMNHYKILESQNIKLKCDFTNYFSLKK